MNLEQQGGRNVIDDPFFKHKKLFFWSVFCLVLSCCLIGFSIFIFPHVFWGLNYAVPSILYSLAQWYRFYYHLSGIGLGLALFLPFFIIGLVFAYIVKIIDSYMDKEAERLAALHGSKPEKLGMDPQTIVAILKAVILVSVVVLIVYFIQDYFFQNSID